MPRGDRTGPSGYGSMTGRRMGYCSGYQRPGYWYFNPGLGFGRGRAVGLGRGRGWRHFGRLDGYPIPHIPLYAPYEAARMAPEREIDHLNMESNLLKEELSQIEKRISELEGEKE